VARHHAGHSRRLGGGQDLGLDQRPSAATGAAPAAERHLDRGLLHRRWAPLLTLNRRDFADFAQHDGLVLLGA
jgi:hypothetical protein